MGVGAPEGQKRDSWRALGPSPATAGAWPGFLGICCAPGRATLLHQLLRYCKGFSNLTVGKWGSPRQEVRCCQMEAGPFPRSAQRLHLR